MAGFFICRFGAARNFTRSGAIKACCPPVAPRQLSLAPGESADAIVDFSGQTGAKIVLNNDSFQPVMQLRVLPSAQPDTSSLPKALRPVRRMAEAEAVKTRCSAWERSQIYAAIPSPCC
jgi:hypothetical protein